MNSYLDEAAALLRKAAEKNERTYTASYESNYLIEGRERIAMKFAQLAAIERGLLPAEMVAELLAHVVHPDQR